MPRKSWPCLAAALAACIIPVDVAHSEPIEDGRQLAQKHCAHCHAIAADDRSRVRQATPFREFPLKWPAAELEKTVFKRMVMGAHPRLPQSVGEPAEFAKLIGYIRSLSTVPGKQAFGHHAAPREIGR